MKGDKVLTVSLTSPFTVIAILEEGAIPVFCDVDESTWTIGIEDCKRKMDKETRAIIPVHLFGNPADMDKIIAFAKEKKLKVIEDACQAHGAIYKRSFSTNKNKKVGSIGDAAAFSFYPTKNLGAMGDGGIVTTNSAKIAKKIKVLRHGGQTKRFWHVHLGVNSRLDEIQAAILEIKLKNLDKDNAKRRNLANKYKKLLKMVPFEFQQNCAGSVPVFHLFVMRVKDRVALHRFLMDSGISTDVYYPHPIHKQPAFRKFDINPLPVTEKLVKTLLAIPIGPNLSPSDQLYIIRKIKQFFEQSK